MVEKLSIYNSSINVSIALQYWNVDSWLPLMEMMGKKGYTIDYSQPTQPIVYKATTTFFRIDSVNKRITFYITNNIESPNTNLEEILQILSLVGFPSEDSIDRIDINGNIIIKVNNGLTSEFISSVINNTFSKKVEEIFGGSTKIAGIRIVSSHYHLEDSNKSPFVILIEPLVTDRSETKFFIQTTLATSNNQYAIHFLKTLYDNLKNIILGSEDDG